MASRTRTSSNPKPFVTTDPAAAFEHFAPLAHREAAASVAVCTLDVEVVRHNVDRGVAAIRPHLALIADRLPRCPIDDLLELPSLALALIFADGRIHRAGSDGEIAERLAALHPLRDAGLKQLEVLASPRLGLVPAARVKAIRAGKGSIDSARDAVDIAATFREHAAALAGKHPFDEATLDELAGHGAWLLQRLVPGAAPARANTRSPAAVVRDELFALIGARYAQLREAGVAAFGFAALDEHVPPLGSRRAATRAQRGSAPPPAADDGAPGPTP